MANLFNKCLHDILGEKEYISFLIMMKEKKITDDIQDLFFAGGKIEDKDLYNKMINIMNSEDDELLEGYAKRVISTQRKIIGIVNGFWKVVFFYTIANIVLIEMQLNYYVTCGALALMGVCFMYKLVEFLSNRYSLIDAYLFVVLKTALVELKKLE